MGGNWLLKRSGGWESEEAHQLVLHVGDIHNLGAEMSLCHSHTLYQCLIFRATLGY